MSVRIVLIGIVLNLNNMKIFLFLPTLSEENADTKIKNYYYK